MNPDLYGMTLNSGPARPYTPTPWSSDLPTPMAMPPPSGFEEWQRQSFAPPPNIAGGEPYSPTPQIGDLSRLFSGTIQRNSPVGRNSSSAVAQDRMRKLMQLPGFSGFSGGDSI